MRPAGVVEGKVAVEAHHGGGDGVVGVQIDRFVLERAPEPREAAGSLRSLAAIMIGRRSRAPRRYLRDPTFGGRDGG